MFLALLCISVTHAQDPDPSWGIKFTGFVKTDILYDSRQPTTTISMTPVPRQSSWSVERIVWAS